MQTKLYIDGELTDGLAGRTTGVINPADGTVLAAVAEYTTQKSVWINVDAALPDWYAP
jgi:acyl-CoA reductase-like NAD-dependent aldehyde dehydrogenase